MRDQRLAQKIQAPPRLRANQPLFLGVAEVMGWLAAGSPR
jgi:hypothetical protein